MAYESGKQMFERDENIPRDSKHCQLVCLKNAKRPSVLILALTF